MKARVCNCLKCARNSKRMVGQPCNTWRNHGKPVIILNCAEACEK